MCRRTTSGPPKPGFPRHIAGLIFALGLLLAALNLAAQPTSLVVSTISGLANFGSQDGIGSAAKFLLPTSVALDSADNLYVADGENDVIRKVTPGGVVTTVAGMAQVEGTNDGTGSVARFNHPLGLALDAAGNIYVADSFNYTIRKITTNGTVTTIAGMAGVPGFYNGVATNQATFLSPSGIAVDGANNIYVADTGNDLIRKIADGQVTTFAGQLQVTGTSNGFGTNAQFSSPFGVAVDAAGNIYVADTDNALIREITPGALVSTLAQTANPPFSSPNGVAVDAASNVYVADAGSEVIRVIAPDGKVTTLAGQEFVLGDSDGSGAIATFSSPWGIAVDGSTNVYVGDSANANIRKITARGIVTTLAGPDASFGLVNGGPAQARFNLPNGVAVDGAGNLYVADTLNNCIRLVTPAGTVTTLAGSVAGLPGSADGTNNNAMFSYPSGVSLDAATNIYVADYRNSTIRKIRPDATHSNWVTTTIAGQAGVFNYQDAMGTNALFYSPIAVAVDPATNVFVSDNGNQLIRKIAPNGMVSTYAGVPGFAGYKDAVSTNAEFDNPIGIAVDNASNVYVADSVNNRIRQIQMNGMVITPTGGGGLFNYPEGVAVDSQGNIYVANTGDETILGITPGGKITTTIAGASGLAGSADGLGSAAEFDAPLGLAVDSAKNVYIADEFNNTIRKGTPLGAQTDVLTVTTSPAGLPVVVDGTNYFSTPRVFALNAGSTIIVSASSTNSYAFKNWTQGATTESVSNSYAFTLGGNVTVVGNFIPAPPTLSIGQAGAEILLLWPSSAGSSYQLESTTTLVSPHWAIVTNMPAVSGGNYVVSNAWMDPTRYFQLISH
jgi:sugar lactone lactonase YvrE